MVDDRLDCRDVFDTVRRTWKMDIKDCNGKRDRRDWKAGNRARGGYGRDKHSSILLTDMESAFCNGWQGAYAFIEHC
jgi:hypothetical protein